jgi:hypothetical protein
MNRPRTHSIATIKTGGNVDILADDILIGDSGTYNPGTKDPLAGKPWKEWKLPDFFEEMKRWPGSPKMLKINKYGHQQLIKQLNYGYQELALWLEYHLLHKNELEDYLFSELLYLKPDTDLALATYKFITLQVYPRLGGEHPWSDLTPTKEHMWYVFEYCLCFREFQSHIRGEAAKSTRGFLKKIKTYHSTEQGFLDEVNHGYAQWNRLLPGKFVQRQEIMRRIILEAMTRNPTFQGNDPVDIKARRCFVEQTLQKFEGDALYLAQLDAKDLAFKSAMAKFCTLFDQMKQLNQQKTPDLIEWHYTLLRIQIFKRILLDHDANLKAHYEQYLREWDIYHATLQNSYGEWQIYYLKSPEADIAVTSSRPGRRPKDKGFSSPKRPGPPLGSSRK